MEKIIFRPFNKDERGVAYELFQGKDWKEVNYITSKKGTVRGNHYHKEMDELIFIAHGNVRVKIVNIKSNEKQEFDAVSGEAFLVKPYELHVIESLTDSILLSLLSKRFDSKSPDLFKI